MSISILLAYKLIVHEEVLMFTQPTTQQVQWQDFKVISEVDLVLKIAQQNGWKDCEIFGSGDMITQPLESMGWKLIPADLYEYSIPDAGVDRILQILNAGVRIQGVIVADDQRKTNHPPTPAKPVISLPSARTIFPLIGKALHRSVAIVAAILLGLTLVVIAGAALLGLVAIAGAVLHGLTTTAGILVCVPLLFLCAALSHDPKLIILVDDGNGGTAWVSVLTWFD
jgi:hypothetical protein